MVEEHVPVEGNAFLIDPPRPDMHIGMILKKFEPSTGKSRHLLEVSKRLVEAGHQISLVTNRVHWKGESEALSHIDIREIGGSQNAIYGKAKEIMQILQRKHVDIIELHGGLTMSLFARAFAQASPVPLLLNIHSQPTDIVKEMHHLSLRDLFYDRKYIIDIDDLIGLYMRARGYDHFWKHRNIHVVIVPSREMKKQYAQKEEVVWIPSGADMHKYAPSSGKREEARKLLGYSAKDRVVLFFSRAVMVRGMDTLIEACERIQKEVRGLRLVFFVLPDVDEGRLRKKIEHSSMRDQISLYVGRNPKMPLALQAADVCVFPFRTTGCIPEQPLTLLEAMASEKAVISTTVGSIPEIVTHGVSGLLVPPNNPDALAKELVHVLTNETFRKQIEQGARKAIQTGYDWDRITTETLHVYERAIAA